MKKIEKKSFVRVGLVSKLPKMTPGSLVGDLVKINNQPPELFWLGRSLQSCRGDTLQFFGHNF